MVTQCLARGEVRPNALHQLFVFWRESCVYVRAAIFIGRRERYSSTSERLPAQHNNFLIPPVSH